MAVNGLAFDAGASSYLVMAGPLEGITIGGAGIVNESGVEQDFVVLVDDKGRQGEIIFYKGASGGVGTKIHAVANPRENRFGGLVTFMNHATGGAAVYETEGGIVAGGFGGEVVFYENASAGAGHYENGAGTVRRAFGGYATFFDDSEAGSATIVLHGATAPNATGGAAIFNDNSSAGNATLVAEAGSHRGGGGMINFNYQSQGGSAQVKLLGNAVMNVSFRQAPIAIGSIEGEGVVELGFFPLTVGSNNRSTTFSGLIEGQIVGTLEKIGDGVFTVSGANTYLGSTIVSGGTMLVANKTGSATGSSDVAVNRGNLGGDGTVSGSVTVGTGSGAGAALAPSAGASVPTITTIQGALSFKADGTYTCKLNSKRARADQVGAHGVTIESGARFNLAAVANRKLAGAVSFTVISNSAATPITGTFANLPNGSTLTVGPNTFQASYSGGDGNDLTLTVLP